MSPLKCLAEVVISHRPYHVDVARESARIVVSSPRGAMTMFTAELRELASFDIQSKVDGLAISPDGELLGISLKDRICISTIRGEILHEIQHFPWGEYAGGGCIFSLDGQFFWSLQPGVEGCEVTVEVLECKGWLVVARASFEADEVGDWMLVAHPEGRVVGAWLGAGQDGQWLYWCGMEEGKLYIEEESALTDTGLPVFNASGGEFLTDNLNEGTLTRHRFPTCKPIRRISEATIFPPQDEDDESDKLSGLSLYVSDRRAIVLSEHGRIWLIGLGAMKIEADLRLEGELRRIHRFDWDDRERLYGDVSQIHNLSEGRLLTVHRDWIGDPTNPEHRLKVWDTTPIGGRIKTPDAERPYTAAFFAHFFDH